MRLTIIWVLFFAYIGLLVYLFLSVDSKESRAGIEESQPETVIDKTREADSLLALVYDAFEAENFDRARQIDSILQVRYPNSSHAEMSAKLIAVIEPDGLSEPRYTSQVDLEKRRLEQTLVAKDRGKGRQVTRQETETEPKGTPIELDLKVVEVERSVPDLQRQWREAMAKTRMVRDESQKITWFYHKNLSRYRYKNSIELSVGHSDRGNTWLRLSIYYNDDKILDIQSFEIYADDIEYTISTQEGMIERGKDNNGVWETFQTRVTANEMVIVKAIMNSERAAIRYRGINGSWERVISEGEKLRMQSLFQAYRALNRQPELVTKNLPLHPQN